MNIFELEFKSTFKSLLIWCGVVALILILFMSFFPSMSSGAMKELVKIKVESMPKSMLAAFGLEDLLNFANIIHYYSYVFQYFVLAGGIYAALLGASSLVKEETDGTIEYLYAQPVTRTQIVTQKLLSAICNYVLFVLATGIVSAILMLAFKPEATDTVQLLTDMKTILAGLLLSGLVFLSVSFMISTLLKSSKQTQPLAFGFVFGTYLLGLLSKTVSDTVKAAKIFKYFSPIDYALPSELIKNGFDTVNITLAFVIIAVSITLAYFIYRQKDLKS